MADNKLVIVIDPGHGGENLGTIENNRIEKDMDMTTALAMYEELMRYDDVEVYLTHTDDVDMSLKERAKFAEEVDADFLFSIHYNASASHELFGSEVWVSSVAPYNAYGYQFGVEFLRDMESLGLVNRGVKIRIGDSGRDYYGIIREGVAREIPTVIIEHCHVDEIHDMDFCDTEEELKAFGVADATAVAKYFGLKSTELNVDYSEYALADVDFDSLVPITVTDKTEPDICAITVTEANYDECELTIDISATDYDSPILYYSVSLDGGETYSLREYWTGSDTLTGAYPDTLSVTLDIPEGTRPEVIVRAYNMFDLYTESNVYEAEKVFTVPEPTPTPMPEPAPDAPAFTVMPAAPAISEEIVTPSVNEILLYLIVAVILILGATALALGVVFAKRKKRH